MPARRTCLLLPPSEGKAPGGRGPGWRATSGGYDALWPHREEVAAAAGLDVLDAPVLPALRRYTGVLYDALDAASLPPAVRRRAATDVVVVSGLAGLVAGGDALPDHKLPIGERVEGLGGLAAWWKPRLSPLLDERVDGCVVWDLLSGAYAAAWQPGGTWRARWVVRVVREAPDGTRTTVSHDNKATKGALARHVLLARPGGPDELADQVFPGGYRVDLASSARTRDGGGVVELVQRAGAESAA